jgi:hypothetical protein
MSETPYREPAEMPAEPSEPVWPRIRAALGRLGILVLAATGPTASFGLCLLGPGAAIIVTVVHIVGSLVSIITKSAQPRHREPDNWFERRSWSEIALLASWAPFAFPMLGLWLLGQWVWTGK